MDKIQKKNEIRWRKITNENLDVDYAILFLEATTKVIMEQMEESIEYYSGNLTKVHIFGKWHQIPRQQVAYGEPGISYTFSGVTIPAKPWTPLLEHLKNIVESVTGYQYNFVLVNKYRNGNDHIGEHRDDEEELDPNTPIASLSFGQRRMFILKHRDARLKGILKRNILPVKLDLESGSILLMNPPTNEYWYHSLPPRKNLTKPRINLTFRKINM